METKPYPVFKANITDALLHQLDSNSMQGGIALRFVEGKGVEYWFTDQKGNHNEGFAPTVAQALYDACCINEAYEAP